jgi:hypothetical protein
MSHRSKKQNCARPNSPAAPTERTVWQLPGGQSLAEFALRAGIVAPKLLATPRPGRSSSSAPAGKAVSVAGLAGSELDILDHDSDHDSIHDEALP